MQIGEKKKKKTYEYGVEKIKLHKNTNLKLGVIDVKTWQIHLF
jgi:hypothetical protein